MSVAVSEHDEIVRMLRDSAAAITPPNDDLRRIRALRYTEPGFDPETWRQMADLGWIGLRVPETVGGSSLPVAAAVALAEALGGGLVPEPLTEVAMAAAMLPAAALQPVLSGALIVIPAWQERAGGLDAAAGAMTLCDGRLHGVKRFIPMAAGAHAFLVTVPDGAALVAADAPGAALTIDRTQDGGHVGTLTCDGAPAEPIEADGAGPLLEATLLTAASLLGVMERAFAMTLDYLRTRTQFGRPIGSFQALQHRAADLRIQIALTRASIAAATSVLDDPTSADDSRRAAVSRAKARASDAALLVTRSAIQLHGGIGYTDDAPIGLFIRRAMVLASRYGNAPVHRARYARLATDTDE
jgi:alkylation response protein AidB-like acyl-CoA dehydrogenase